VLVNGIIMSVYLWHLTTMIWIVGIANLSGGFGLHLHPGSAAWWSSRPLWLALLLAALMLVLPLAGRFERRPGPKPGAAPPVWMSCGGAILACAGLALLALDGIGSDCFLGIRWVVILLTFAGGALMGLFWPRSVSS